MSITGSILQLVITSKTLTMNGKRIIQKAEFNPKIIKYIQLTVGFFLLISIIGIPVLIIWILGLGRYYGKKYYRSLSCILSDRHLEFKKGAFFKVEKTIPLENIQDLTFVENPILNLLELKILKIETAGGSNPHGSDMQLIGIIEADQFKKKVLNQRDLLSLASSKANTHDDILQNEKILIEIRDLLKEIKDQGSAKT